MKKILSLPALLICATVCAQTISPSELSKIQSSFVKDGSTAAIQNILVNNKSIKALALNHSAEPVDHFFKYTTSVKGITDQQSSGRCWMFTSMNQLRPIAMKRYNVSSFDFSHNFSYFWDMFEKANLFLEDIIATADRSFDDREVVTYFKSPVSDGGVWNLFWNIGEKYGVVPAEIMPETEHSNNTSQMLSILNERLRAGGYELREMCAAGKSIAAVRDQKVEILKDVYRVLALCLGEPPAEFTWRYKDKDGKVQTVKTTPAEFYKSVIPANYNPDTYVMIMNDPTRPYYKVYEIENYRNSVEGINWYYLNLPNDVIKVAALKSIKADEPMYASCDVGKQSNTAAGAGILDPGTYDYESLMGVKLAMDKKARILTRQSGSSHAMLIVACDTDDNDVPVKWQFENSWGAASGDHGYLTFTDRWFDEYLFRIVINRKYLDSKSINALSGEHVMLPCWDYMF
ncbi:MAG: C1 family peptidase [Bacteroidales bacterium]|nr:C1 family peptidase [Bacteroidales bacterium]